MGDGVLTGNMSTSGKDRLKKVVPNDDTDIWTLSQDAPYPPRIQQKRWKTGAVLMGKMTSSGKDCKPNMFLMMILYADHL